MSYHCLEPIPNGLFVMGIDLHTYIYEHETSQWQNIKQSFPCDHRGILSMTCKSHQDQTIIVPSVKDGSACTAIFYLTSKTWTRMEVDHRNAPFNGILQHLPNAADDEEILLYFGGHSGKTVEELDQIIWKLSQDSSQWEMFLSNYHLIICWTML